MFEECFAALTHPLPTLFLIIYTGKEKTFEILRKHQKEFFQFYRSNRLRGHDTKTSIERAAAGYGCYKGWRAESVSEIKIWNYFI